MKVAFPWPMGSSLPSMILAGLIFSVLSFRKHERS
jgi:hypothetical protein